MGIHKILFFKDEKKVKVFLKRLSRFFGKYGALQCSSIEEGEGGCSGGGKGKATQEKERAERSTGLRGDRQNVGQGVFDASHGCRSENSAAEP